MAHSFGSLAGGGAGGADGAKLVQGPDLELIQTEGLGFLNLARETKLQFVSKWTEPPLDTASLISIASRKGLVAAAGPDAVNIATTDAVRKAMTSDDASKDDDNNVRPFASQITIPMAMRVSQLAFTADDRFLVLSAETGGGLAVYDVQALLSMLNSGGGGGEPKPAFELSTNGETVRSLVVNPMPDKAELCALVTAKGNLLMADLQQRALRNGPSGQPVLRSQVSSAAWSSRGKQLVAGCADGSVYQMTPDGHDKAHIPKPPSVGDCYVASLAWLENDVFLVVHNPTAPGDPSAYHIVTRNSKASPPELVFQRLDDPVEPYGDKQPHHTVLRLRDFPPNLQDVLVVASTAVDNVGLLTRSKAPLSSSEPADKITNVFTTTELADDSRRAQLPMSSDYSETYPVGAALDLSSTDKVFKPIPSDEMDESPGPLPAVWVLNNEGILLAWWVVYNDSIREGTTFPGLVAVDGGGTTSAASATASTPAPAPALSVAALCAAAPSAATPRTAPAFGVGATPASSAPAFGASPWGQSAATPSATATATATPSRAPAFGAPSVLGGAAFGAPSGLAAAKPSVWGSGTKTSSGPAFGQTSFGSSAPAPASAPAANPFSSFANKSPTSPFGSATPAASSGKPAAASPFGAFGKASESGFASLASAKTSGSIFGSGSSSNKPFGAASSGGGSFGAPAESGSLFGKPAGTTAGSPFGSTPFVLGTTFKADPQTANDNEKVPEKGDKGSGGGGGLFSGGFGLSLADAAKTEPAPAGKDEDMDTTASVEPPTPPTPAPAPAARHESTTPTTTPAPGRFLSPLTSNDKAAATSLFGSSSSKPFSGFSKPAGASTAITSSTGTTPSLFGSKTPGSTSAAPSLSAPSLFGKASTGAAGTGKGLFGLASSSSGMFSGFAKPAESAKDGAAAETPNPFKSSNPAASSEPPLPPLPSNPFAKPKKETTAVPDAPLPPDSFTKPKAGSAADKAALYAPLPPVPEAKSAAAPSLFASLGSSSKPASIFSSGATVADDGGMRNPFANLPQEPLSPSTDGSDEGFSEEEEDHKQNQDKEDEDEEIEEIEDDESELEGDDEDEGSGTDIGKDVPDSPNDLVKTPSFATQGSSFTTGGATDASVTSGFSHIEPPSRSQMFGAPPDLRPPRQQETSPRSPSPQRPPAKLNAGLPAGRLFREESQRSFSAPGMASQLLRDSRQGRLPASGPQSGGRRTVRDANLEEQRKADEARVKAEAEAEAVAAAVREEDSYDVMNRELDQPLPPTLQLAECVYILDSDIAGGDSVASQVEAVYRDINRMVLVLKLNSRNIDAFLRGHSQSDRKTEEDLDNADGWVLCDVDALGAIVGRDLPTKLRQARVKGEGELFADASALLRDGSRLQVMHDDMVRIIQSQTSPDHAAKARSLPLSAEQATQQSDLRRTFTKFSEQLVEAEQKLVLLRTKVASLAASGAPGASGASSASSGKAPAVPTVDAVMRTIKRMTAMAEKRSGDIDVLEAQIRKLNLGASAGAGAKGTPRREGSPFSFSTPKKSPQKRSSVTFAPGSTQRSGTQHSGTQRSGGGPRSSAMYAASPGLSAGASTPTRRKLTGYTDQEKALLRQKRAGRQRTLDRLHRVQQAEGPRYMPMDD